MGKEGEGAKRVKEKKEREVGGVGVSEGARRMRLFRFVSHPNERFDSIASRCETAKFAGEGGGESLAEETPLPEKTRGGGF